MTASTWSHNYIFHMDAKSGTFGDYVHSRAVIEQARQQNVPPSICKRAAQTMTALYKLDADSARIVESIAEGKQPIHSLANPFLVDRAKETGQPAPQRIAEVRHGNRSHQFEILPPQSPYFDWQNASTLIKAIKVPAPVRQQIANKMIEAYNFPDAEQKALHRIAEAVA